MAFSEALKVALRKRADMRCCLCHALGIEIHHITPEAEGGPDSEDNAAPLCPSCHETFGANPIKRKFIREAKDNWLEAVERRLQDTAAGMAAVLGALERSATKEDLAALREDLVGSRGGKRRSSEATKGPKALPLGTILAHVFSFVPKGRLVADADVEFLYLFVFGGSLHDPEWDALRESFGDQFGKETARRLCRFQLGFHDHILSKDGFTEDEMQSLVSKLMINIIYLLGHVEVTDSPELALALGLDPDGRIRAWSLKHAPPQSPYTLPSGAA